MENKQIKIKRAYEKYSKNDGARILVDRLWPRGKTKKGLKIKEWMKDIAPSLELIKWFGHDQKKWPDFKQKYKKELKEKKELAEKLKQTAKNGALTLLYSAKDTERNNAVALKEFLEE